LHFEAFGTHVEAQEEEVHGEDETHNRIEFDAAREGQVHQVADLDEQVAQHEEDPGYQQMPLALRIQPEWRFRR